MTDNHADAHIDDALEALARPDLPADHVARVLARTRAAAVASDGSASRPSAMLRRWALPLAASLLIAAGVTWVGRAPSLPAIVADRAGGVTDGAESRPYQAWGALREVDRPVLPPQAYWGMDAFEEWRRLGRAAMGAQASRHPAPGNRQFTSRRPPRDSAAAGPLAWAPAPSGLPPIELESIAPAPLAVVPLPDPSPIELPAIRLEPIVIAPLAEEERP